MPPGFARICDDTACVDRDPRLGSFQPQDDRRTTRIADRDPYRGENVADLRVKAQSGDADAAYRLGEAYGSGLGRVPRDATKAVQAFELGAAVDPGLQRAGLGHAHASYTIGSILLTGNGARRNADRAARWFTVAAENGVAEAQFNLGLMLQRGQGVQQDLYESLQWLRRAAQGGYLPAQKMVGRIYMTGLDTMGQDVTEARTWLSIAAGRGDGDTRRWLAQIDQAEKVDRDYQRTLQRRSAETASFMAQASFAAAM